MSIQSQWLTFDVPSVHKELDAPGVYELGDRIGGVIYIGGAPLLRRRLLEHLDEPDSSCISLNAQLYRTEYDVDPVTRAKQLHEEHLHNHGEPPRCNE
jgi:excinuclease UvrABC nuclease subunit